MTYERLVALHLEKDNRLYSGRSAAIKLDAYNHRNTNSIYCITGLLTDHTQLHYGSRSRVSTKCQTGPSLSEHHTHTAVTPSGTARL